MTREIQKKKQALVDFLDDGELLRGQMMVDAVRRSLPPEWDEIDLDAKATPKKAKIKLRLDEDVITFFRGMGPGYTLILNRVLRTFMTGRIANALFVRENAIDIEELITGYRNKSFAELQEWVRERERVR
ncbi:MAG: BrnA antitoxin family protein [Pseudomonadota bacterium]